MSNARLTVAVAQMESRLGDLDHNLSVHLTMVDRARSAGVDCLLFPEFSLTGHGPGVSALDVALKRDDPSVMAVAAASGPMCTVFGLVEEGPAAQFYNSAIAVKEGELVFIHRKIALATYGRLEDGKHFASGRYVETFTLTPDWRVSVLICNDLWNPALVHLAALHGATLLLAPVSSGREAVGAEFDNPGGWERALTFYASIYGLPIAFANRVGADGDLSFWGGSRILDPYGRTLAQADADGEAMIAAEIDYEAVRRSRYQLPTVRDSNLSLIAREIARLEHIIGVPESLRRQ